MRIQGTPSFIISSKKGNDMLTGAKTFDEMSAVIDGHLQAVYK